MTSILRRSGALLISVGLLVGPLSATSAEAAGSCSISVPSKVSIESPYKKIKGTLGRNCGSSGVEYASWDVIHRYYGPNNIFIFDETTTDTIGFYDFEDMGTYDVEGSYAYDDNYDDVAQRDSTMVIRLGSRLNMTSSRSGSYVTLKAAARRYSPTYERFAYWKSKPVKVQYRTSSGSWKTLKTVKTNSKGAISVKLKASSTRTYRAVTADQTNSWGRTSNTVRR